MNTSGTSGRQGGAGGEGHGAPPAARGRLLAGRYRLVGELGRGGMGTVWRARDETLRREVAVKEVSVPFGLPEEDVARLHARLEREARAAGRIEHPGVAEVFDVVRQDGRPWIVMELVRGVTLQDVLEADGPLEPQRAASVGAQVLSALRAAHGSRRASPGRETGQCAARPRRAGGAHRFRQLAGGGRGGTDGHG